jgi:hypothetical protein
MSPLFFKDEAFSHSGTARDGMKAGPRRAQGLQPTIPMRGGKYLNAHAARTA